MSDTHGQGPAVGTAGKVTHRQMVEEARQELGLEAPNPKIRDWVKARHGVELSLQQVSNIKSEINRARKARTQQGHQEQQEWQLTLDEALLVKAALHGLQGQLQDLDGFLTNLSQHRPEMTIKTAKDYLEFLSKLG